MVKSGTECCILQKTAPNLEWLEKLESVKRRKHHLQCTPSWNHVDIFIGTFMDPRMCVFEEPKCRNFKFWTCRIFCLLPVSNSCRSSSFNSSISSGGRGFPGPPSRHAEFAANRSQYQRSASMGLPEMGRGISSVLKFETMTMIRSPWSCGKRFVAAHLWFACENPSVYVSKPRPGRNDGRTNMTPNRMTPQKSGSKMGKQDNDRTYIS